MLLSATDFTKCTAVILPKNRELLLILLQLRLSQQCFLQQQRMYDVFCSQNFPTYIQNAYCAIKMLFKTAHKNIWLERFFMLFVHNFTGWCDFFGVRLSLSLSFSVPPSEIVLRKIWASIAAVVGPVCCCTFFGCFWLLLTIFWIEFVNKQIKAKDHIKRRQYCICTQQPSTSSQCTRNMPHGVSWWHLAPTHKIHTSCYIKWCFCFCRCCCRSFASI